MIAQLEPGQRFTCVKADAEKFLRGLADDSIDLLFTSPPYEAARTYGIGFKRSGQDWVDWMVEVVKAADPKVKGLIAINCEGQTRNYSYSGTPFLLFADLKRAGFNMRKPAVFQRVGIPGSGGPDWLRNDWEPIICVSRPGKMPWSDNTACGHAPKWAPGGEMSHMVSSGKRVNQWGPVGSANGAGKRFHHGEAKGGSRKARPSHRLLTKEEKLSMGAKPHTKRDNAPQLNGKAMRDQAYLPPAIANPGNVIECVVGGGVMGHPIAHRNEAPFPLDLPAFFVKSFCPPGGVVCDPFVGSGTTAHAAIENGRRFIGCDIRKSQVELATRRVETVTPDMYAEVA